MIRHSRTRWLPGRATAVIAALVLCGSLSPQVVHADQTDDEIKLGAQAAKDIESRYRVVTDPAMVERLNTVVNALVPVLDRHDLPAYHVKILDIPGVNAVGIPGGWVYVTKGMMKFVRSDHELAAVLAHEFTHVAHRHYYIQQERQSRMLPVLIAAAILSALARSAVPLYGVSLATQGALANYSRDLEREADLNGIAYLTKTGYSPVAMLTLMEHLAQADKLAGQPDYSDIYLDHPRPDERVAYIAKDLAARRIPIVRRIPEAYLQLTVDPAAAVGDQPVTILVDGRPVFQLGATVGSQAPAQRVPALLDRLNVFFDSDPAPYDVHAVNIVDQWSVIGGQTHLFDVTPQDAAYAKTSQKALAEQFRSALAAAIGRGAQNRKC